MKEYKIKEQYEKYTIWFKVKGVIEGVLLIFVFPFIYLVHFFKPDVPEAGLMNWFGSPTDKLEEVTFVHVSDNEMTEMVESDTLSFPKWEDFDDPFRFIHKIETKPQIEYLDEMYFDEEFLKMDKGFYLIRINKKGLGMTLCYLSLEEGTLIDIHDLLSLSWHIEQLNNTNLELTGYAGKGKHTILIEKSHHKS